MQTSITVTVCNNQLFFYKKLARIPEFDKHLNSPEVIAVGGRDVGILAEGTVGGGGQWPPAEPLLVDVALRAAKERYVTVNMNISIIAYKK